MDGWTWRGWGTSVRSRSRRSGEFPASSANTPPSGRISCSPDPSDVGLPRRGRKGRDSVRGGDVEAARLYDEDRGYRARADIRSAGPPGRAYPLEEGDQVPAAAAVSDSANNGAEGRSRPGCPSARRSGSRATDDSTRGQGCRQRNPQDGAAGGAGEMTGRDDPVPLGRSHLRAQAERGMGLAQGGQVAHEPSRSERRPAGRRGRRTRIATGAEGAVVAGTEEDVDGVVEAPGGAGHGGTPCPAPRPARLGQRGIRLAEPRPGEEGEDAGRARGACASDRSWVTPLGSQPWASP